MILIIYMKSIAGYREGCIWVMTAASQKQTLGFAELRSKEQENANERKCTQIRSKAYWCSAPEAHKPNIGVYSR
jgi:hypothetical protein